MNQDDVDIAATVLRTGTQIRVLQISTFCYYVPQGEYFIFIAQFDVLRLDCLCFRDYYKPSEIGCYRLLTATAT